MSAFKDFSVLKEKIQDMPPEAFPSRNSSLKEFFNATLESIRFILSEKENITFAIMQWVSIALLYLVWIQILRFVTPELVASLTNADPSWTKNEWVVSIIFVLWGVVCVGIASFPIGIFTACMASSYILRSEKRDSTITDCLSIVMPRAWPIWLFSWYDGWLTVRRILSRLPKKNDTESAQKKAKGEAIYQAWKLASLGVIPALSYGRSVTDSCKDSLLILGKKFKKLAILRIGYSTICWVIGILSYLSLFFFSLQIEKRLETYYGFNSTFSFYLVAVLPIMIALLIIMIFVRPLYIVSSTRIYVEYVHENGIERLAPKQFSQFACLALLLLIMLGTVWGLISLDSPLNKLRLAATQDNVSATAEHGFPDNDGQGSLTGFPNVINPDSQSGKVYGARQTAVERIVSTTTPNTVIMKAVLFDMKETLEKQIQEKNKNNRENHETAPEENQENTKENQL